MTKKRLPATESEFNQRRDVLFDLLSQESDRGVVMVSASFLDEALELLLRAWFSSEEHIIQDAINPLFGAIGPLATFSAKIRLCYALSLLKDWEYNDLEVVREIRNGFAHELREANFGHPEVSILTERLAGADEAVTAMSKYKAEPETEPADNKSEANKTNQQRKGGKSDKQVMERMRFTLTVVFIGAALYTRIPFLETLSPKFRIKGRTK